MCCTKVASPVIVENIRNANQREQSFSVSYVKLQQNLLSLYHSQYVCVVRAHRRFSYHHHPDVFNAAYEDHIGKSAHGGGMGFAEIIQGVPFLKSRHGHTSNSVLIHRFGRSHTSRTGLHFETLEHSRRGVTVRVTFDRKNVVMPTLLVTQKDKNVLTITTQHPKSPVLYDPYFLAEQATLSINCTDGSELEHVYKHDHYVGPCLNKRYDDIKLKLNIEKICRNNLRTNLICDVKLAGMVLRSVALCQ